MGGYKRPINSVKHVIDSSGALVTGTVSINQIAVAGRLSDATTPVTVTTGCNVGPIYLSVFVLGTTGGDSGLVDWYLWKEPANLIQTIDEPTPGNTGISPLRRFIFHEEKGLAATQDGTPMVFKGVIKIPPRFRRMGDGDQIKLHLLSDFPATFCIKSIYKEYT